MNTEVSAKRTPSDEDSDSVDARVVLRHRFVDEDRYRIDQLMRSITRLTSAVEAALAEFTKPKPKPKAPPKKRGRK